MCVAMGVASYFAKAISNAWAVNEGIEDENSVTQDMMNVNINKTMSVINCRQKKILYSKILIIRY
ncbi:hypothetical protein OCA16_19580 [Bacillus cereus]|nr:hypothetical protein [Bacillus cereus]